MTPAEALSNPNLELKLYGPTAKEFLMTGSAGDENNPTHLWTGMCTSPCGATLRDKANMVDLSGLARIKWNTKMSGFHQVRPLIKLADGTYLVGDKADGSSTDWLWSEISFADVKWLRVDIATGVTKGTFVANPDLTKVDEVGYIDLMPGSGHGAGGWSDVAQIEVYGRPVAAIGRAHGRRPHVQRRAEDRLDARRRRGRHGLRLAVPAAEQEDDRVHRDQQSRPSPTR